MGKTLLRKAFKITYNLCLLKSTWMIDRVVEQIFQRDVKAFSDVWVKEKGMPVLQAKVKDGNLVVMQSDSWDRGLIWPQQMKYRLVEDGIAQDVVIEIDESSPIATRRLKHKFSSPLILPNIDGRGYGFFKMEAHDVESAFAYMNTVDDDC